MVLGVAGRQGVRLKRVQVIKPTASKVEVPGDTLIEGQVDPQTQLYMVDLPTNHAPITAPGGDTCIHNDSKYLTSKANLITIKPVQQLINFYHMTFGAPPISSWKKAIVSQLLTFTCPRQAWKRATHPEDANLCTPPVTGSTSTRPWQKY